MAMLDNFKTIKLKLDYKTGLVSSAFAQVKVGEDGALLEVQLTDGENVLDLSSVKLSLQYHNLESDAADEVPFTALPGKTGWFRVEIPDHATSKAGFIRCAIVVNDGEHRIHTGNFDVYCEGSPVEPLAVYESDNFKTFLKALGVADGFAEKADKLLNDQVASFDNTIKEKTSELDSAIAAKFDELKSTIQAKISEVDGIVQSKVDYVDTKTQEAITSAKSKVDAAAEEWNSSLSKKQTEFDNALSAEKQIWQSERSKQSQEFNSNIQNAKDALASINESKAAKEQAYDNALQSDKAKYASSLSAQEQAYTKSLSEHESSWESQQASAKNASDGRINKLDNIIAAYEGETPLTPKIADVKYQPKGDYATKSDLETLADSEALSSLASKEELKSYIKDESSSIKTDNLADGSVTPDKLSETYLKPSDAESKYQPKGDYASKSTATTTKSGLISYSDKAKLNSIESGAQKNTVTSVNGKTGAVTIEEPAVATTSKSGLISASDQAKLNGIQAGAQKNPDLSGYATKSQLTSELKKKQDTGSYVASTDVLKIKVVTSIPASVEPNTLYLVKE